MTIHPFDAGNGRIARAIADMALARSEHSAQRFTSMSVQIRRQRVAYFAMLAEAQKGDLDITSWLEWFLDCLGRAVDIAEDILGPVLHKGASGRRMPVCRSMRDSARWSIGCSMGSRAG